MELIKDIFEYLGILLIFINTILYFSSYRFHLKPVAYFYFSLYLLITFVINTKAYYLASYKMNNLYLSHYYFITQFLLLSLFYRSLFNKSQKKIVIIIILVVFTILSIQYILKPDLYYSFNLMEVFITSLPIVIYSIIHLYNSLNKQGKFMYINGAILIYITTSTLIFILGDYMSEFRDNNAIKNIWFINQVLYVLYLSLILYEWKINFQQVKNK